MTPVRAAIGDLVRYGFGPTALMRVTTIIMGRYYGRAFHSSGTCTSRDQVFVATPDDRQRWARCHDANDQWIRGAWGTDPAASPSDAAPHGGLPPRAVQQQ